MCYDVWLFSVKRLQTITRWVADGGGWPQPPLRRWGRGVALGRGTELSEDVLPSKERKGELSAILIWHFGNKTCHFSLHLWEQFIFSVFVLPSRKMRILQATDIHLFINSTLGTIFKYRPGARLGETFKIHKVSSSCCLQKKVCESVSV